MFYQFKPTKTGDRMRPSPSPAPTRYRHLIEKMTGNVRAFTSRHPGIGKLFTVVALAVMAAVIAGMLFYQGVFQAQQTVFKIDLSNTLLGERISAPQGVAKQRALDLYLDSLDRAITADSIENLKTQKSKDHADAQLH